MRAMKRDGDITRGHFPAHRAKFQKVAQDYHLKTNLNTNKKNKLVVLDRRTAS